MSEGLARLKDFVSQQLAVAEPVFMLSTKTELELVKHGGSQQILREKHQNIPLYVILLTYDTHF